MKVRELINQLMDQDMDAEVYLNAVDCKDNLETAIEVTGLGDAGFGSWVKAISIECEKSDELKF